MKYNQKEVANILFNNGLILHDEYINTKKCMFCTDNDGYKYSIRLADILSGRQPIAIHAKNPYVLDNIDIFLINNNLTMKRLSMSYHGSKYGMLWKCECGREFEATWSDIQGGKRYCNFCAKSKRFDGLKDYTLAVKQECEHRGYTLLTEYIHRSTSYFEYICKKHSAHGAQRSTYDVMINTGRGCKYCGIESRTEKHKLPENVLKELTESKGFIYMGCDYDNQEDTSNKVNIHVICPKHIEKGIQKMKYDNLKRNTGKCIYCMGHGRTKDDLQNELDEQHGLVDILTYTQYSDPITARCKVCGYIWDTTGPSLINGHRCPRCVRSKFEIEISKILDKYGYNYEFQYAIAACRDINPLPFDFYLLDYNILIEADGEGHYKPIRRGSMTIEEAEMQLEVVRKHDCMKTQYCIDNNIRLIRIPYWERKNAERFLLNELNNIIYNTAT